MLKRLAVEITRRIFDFTGVAIVRKKSLDELHIHIDELLSYKTTFSKSNYYKNEKLRVERQQALSKLPSNTGTKYQDIEILNKRRAARIEKTDYKITPPTSKVAFLTVGNDKFLPGLEGLLLSLTNIYTDLTSDVYIYHDGTLTDFSQKRLTEIYPNTQFIEDDMSWLELVNQTSENHQRIGKLGYMNINALKYSQYDHMVVLDSDMLIQQDISHLWQDDESIKFCYDIGDREYAAFTEYTDDYIINSGMLSIPKRYLSHTYFKEMQSIVADTHTIDCQILQRFADQKAWNVFLKNKQKKELPTNFNCNIKYTKKHCKGYIDFISILHFTGKKPWLKSEYIDNKFEEKTKPSGLAFHYLWEINYRKLLAKHRINLFHNLCGGKLKKLEKTGLDNELILVGNGPSLKKVDFNKLKNKTKIAFNWFVNHEDFDEIKIDHLVIASHMLFGGWNTQNPTFPAEYLEKLRKHKHKPKLWTSFYFKPLFIELGLEEEFDCNYLLFEKPFKEFIDQRGMTELDAFSFLDDGRTGVITFGMTIAKLAKYKTVYLIGCDSNYSGNPEENYFYSSKEHTSMSTNKSSLNETWLSDSYGQYCYNVAHDALAREDIELFDCTIDGKLSTIPKKDISELYKLCQE